MFAFFPHSPPLRLFLPRILCFSVQTGSRQWEVGEGDAHPVPTRVLSPAPPRGAYRERGVVTPWHRALPEPAPPRATPPSTLGRVSSMARAAGLATLVLATLVLGASRAQDLDLADGLRDDEPKKPVPTPKKPSGDDFNLEDAIGEGHGAGGGNPRKDGEQGGFSDSDLMDGNSGGQGEGHGAGGGNPRKDGEQETPQGVIPGIVGAVLAALVGAVSSFIAYQKKKLCFKENDPAKV